MRKSYRGVSFRPKKVDNKILLTKFNFNTSSDFGVSFKGDLAFDA